MGLFCQELVRCLRVEIHINKEEIKNYTTNALPNELMEELETIMPCFGSIQIWYDDKQKDPVCVATEYSYGIDDKAGHKQEQFGVFATEEQVQEYIEKNNLEGHKPYNYLFSAKQYLIARWGDELKPLSFLAEMAKKRYIISERRKQMKKKLEAEQELAMIELDAEEKFFI